jgi:hypothetical protein
MTGFRRLLPRLANCVTRSSCTCSPRSREGARDDRHADPRCPRTRLGARGEAWRHEARTGPQGRCEDHPGDTARGRYVAAGYRRGIERPWGGHSARRAVAGDDGEQRAGARRLSTVAPLAKSDGSPDGSINTFSKRCSVGSTSIRRRGASGARQSSTPSARSKPGWVQPTC